MQCTVHEAIKPISWLLGKWVSDNGNGSYPTIQPFSYNEEIEFTTVGQPMLNYIARTWHPEKKTPMHSESGFLRIKPGTNHLAFMVAHNFGLNTIEEGEVTDKKVNLRTNSIIRMSFAKEPHVTKIERSFKLNCDTLEQTVFMETTQTSLTQHLFATYKKAAD